MKNKKLIYDCKGKVRFAPNVYPEQKMILWDKNDFDFASLYPYKSSAINIRNLIRKEKIKKIFNVLHLL